jgi:molybdenum cofactor synthesis domain-containing protein
MRTAAVLTISDSSARGDRADRSGPATAELLRQEGFDVTHQEIVPDDQPAIESALVRLSDQVQLIVTTGGTGIADRDVTPEATRTVCSKASTSNAILSRGVCGVRGRTLILNLPGSPTGASESLLAVIEILPHAIDLLAGKTGHDDARPPRDK